MDNETLISILSFMLVMKCLGGFLVSLGLAVLISKIVGDHKKQLFYVVSCSIAISLALLLVMSLVYGSVFVYEIYAYIVGIVAAMICVIIFFIIKSVTGSSGANAVEILNIFKKGKRVRLRALMEMAIVIEDQGNKFYLELAERVADEGVKELCGKLAVDEIQHKELIEQTMLHWIPYPAGNIDLSKFDKKLNRLSIFKNPPSLYANVEDMVRYAVEQEKRLASFYTSIEKMFSAPWKKMHVQTLIMEERKHALLLIAAYPQIGEAE